MEIMDTAEYENETIQRALSGDAEAGREALMLCRTGLAMRTLSPVLADYLAARLDDVLAGIKPDRALCVANGPGQPPDPFPEWQQELGAFAALLSGRNYKPGQINAAMEFARRKVHQKDLNEREAREIRATWKPLLNLKIDELVRIAGPCGDLLKEYPPRKK